VYLWSDLQRRPDLEIDTANGAVTAIRVYSRRYKTDAGIGVGDSIVTLANRYPIRWRSDDAAEVEDLKMRFYVENETITSILVS